MFMPEDLKIRQLRESDVCEVTNMITYVQREEEVAELRRQVRAVKIHLSTHD